MIEKRPQIQARMDLAVAHAVREQYLEAIRTTNAVLEASGETLRLVGDMETIDVTARDDAGPRVAPAAWLKVEGQGIQAKSLRRELSEIIVAHRCVTIEDDAGFYNVVGGRRLLAAGVSLEAAIGAAADVVRTEGRPRLLAGDKSAARGGFGGWFAQRAPSLLLGYWVGLVVAALLVVAVCR